MKETALPVVQYVHFSSNIFSSLLPSVDALPLSIISSSGDKATSLPHAHAYLVELDALTKERLALFSLLSKRHKLATLYVIAPPALQQILLYKYALHVGIKEIFSTPANQDHVLEICSKIHLHLTQKAKEQEWCELGMAFEKHIPFLRYIKEKTPAFLNVKAKEFIGEESALPWEAFSTPLSVLTDTEGNAWHTFCHTFSGEKEKFALFFPYEKEAYAPHAIPLLSRAEATKWLRNRLSENSRETPALTLLLITIDNVSSLQKELSDFEYEAMLQPLHEALTSLQPPILLFSAWEEGVYLLALENGSLEMLKTDVEALYETLSHNQTAFPLLVLSTAIWRGASGALPEVIQMLDSLAGKTLEAKEIKNLDVALVDSSGEPLGEHQQILRTFYNFMVNKTSLKLQNIYKGLCINTASRILKIKDKMVHFECQTLQSYAATESKKIVILSPELPFDIHGAVKFVSLEDKYLIADSFYFLPDSANSREYTRVQPSFRTPVFLKQGRLQLQGEMLDVSLKSVAFTTRQSVVNLVQNQSVLLTFKVPDDATEEGFVEIRGTGKVVSCRPYKDIVYKIVVLLSLKDPHDAFLLRYMYMRQKELINELKQFTKNGH